jgi:F-type H+-transporting ATPase subunit epsilon
MAGTLHFDLVSPERRLASLAATEVGIPGTAGDLTAMEGHEATITTLRPGILRAVTADGVRAFAVTGGFAEITGSGVTVLAENAVPVEELTGTLLDNMIDEARSLLAVALPEDRDAAEKVLHDLHELKVQAGH